MARLLALLCLILLPTASAAQAPPCGPRSTVIATLGDKYGESIIGRGLTATGGVLEFYANPASGTFSAVLSVPQGGAVFSCLVTAGKDWQIITPKTPEDPA